jgi:hypothetical protein
MAYSLIAINKNVPQDIQDWEELFNSVYIVAPTQRMSLKRRQFLIKVMICSIMANDKKNNTKNFNLLYDKHKSLITRIATENDPEFGPVFEEVFEPVFERDIEPKVQKN